MNGILSLLLGWLRHWLARLYGFLDLPPIEEDARWAGQRARAEPARMGSGKILEFRARPCGDARAGGTSAPRRVLLVQTARYYDDS